MKKQIRICKKCNAQIAKNQKFCSVCGEKVEVKKLSKKSKAMIAGGMLLVAAGGIAISLCLKPVIEKYNIYQEAVSYYSAGQYEQAQNMFEKLEDYKDSKQKAIDACIGRTEQFIEDKDFKNAREILNSAPKSANVKSAQNLCDYKEAESMVEKEDYKNAYKIYKKLAAKKYKDADVLEKEVLPKAAEDIFVHLMEICEEEKKEKDGDDYHEKVHYTFFDFEKDGVNELIFSPNGNDLVVYAFQDGEVKTLLDDDIEWYGYGISYDPNSKICIASVMEYSDKYLYYEHDNKKEKYKASESEKVYKKIGYSASNSESIDLWY